MPELMVFLSGEIVPESEARISLFDRGFIFGDAVYDVARTFGHQPFKLREHIERLYGSLHYVQIDPGLSKDEMEEKTLDLVERNRPAFEPRRDYRICHWISRGVNPASYGIDECGPATVSIFNYPILSERWADEYDEGLRLLSSSIRRTPPESIDSQGKINNKMNHILAGLQVAAADKGAEALMLDIRGRVAETPHSNIFIVRGGRLLTPPLENVLAGVSRATALELAARLGIPAAEEHMTPLDVMSAEEAFITNTGYSLLPVSSLDGRKIGEELPGPITRRLTDAWCKMIEFDFVAQARELEGE
ncbi:MAG: aminotransferase class IV [Nitrospinota bacterium]|nr:aminotransferase class IV [Nitrospinota bacterium]